MPLHVLGCLSYADKPSLAFLPHEKEMKTTTLGNLGLVLSQWCCSCCCLALVLLVLETLILMFGLPERESQLSACSFHMMCPSHCFYFPFVFMLSSKKQPCCFLVFHGFLAQLSRMLMCPCWHHTKLITLVGTFCFWLDKQGVGVLRMILFPVKWPITALFSASWQTLWFSELLLI